MDDLQATSLRNPDLGLCEISFRFRFVTSHQVQSVYAGVGGSGKEMLPHRGLVVLLVGLRDASASHFIGPFGGPRTGTGTAAAGDAPAVGGGLSPDEVRSMMKNRHALVIAGDDELTAVAVAEGLVDVGASVVLGCKRPERALRAVKKRRIAMPTSERGKAAEVAASAGGDAEPEEEEERWCAGCEVRALDLTSRSAVYAFAETMIDEDRPLHVIVNCADDMEPFYSRAPQLEGGWEATVGANHLGPFLLTQLLLDQVVTTMRNDAATTRSRARQARLSGRRTSGARAASSSSSGGDARRVARGAAGSSDEEEPTSPPPLVARPYPAPFGKVVWLGLHARVGSKASAPPPALRGLFLGAANYTGWSAYRCAHEANTLVSLQLNRMLRAVTVPTTEECVEVNIVRPARGRWLPRTLRQALGTANGAALTATFLASTPMRGLSGLYFDDFTAAPPWRQSAERAGLRQARASKQVYAASMSLAGSPKAQWRSEATMVIRGQMAMQRKRAAEVRGRLEAQEEKRREKRREGLRELDAEALLREVEGPAEKDGRE